MKKRSKGKPQEQYQCPDYPIGFPIELHQGLNLLLLAEGQRLVQAIAYGRANAQLGKGEHGKDIGEQSGEAKILQGEECHKDLACDEAADIAQDEAQGSKLDVSH